MAKIVATGFIDPLIASKLKGMAQSLEPDFSEELEIPSIQFGDLRIYTVEVKETITAAQDGSPRIGLKVGKGKAYLAQRNKKTDILEYWIAPKGKRVVEEIFNLTTASYVPGTLLLVVQDRDGDLWVKEDQLANAVIVFRLLADRSREKNSRGKLFGRAPAIVEDVLGPAPVSIDDIITVIFANSRWLGAVENCQGIADYYADDGGNFIVKECQTLTAGFWFRTLEPRIRGQRDQDVEVEILVDIHGKDQYVEHANADFPVRFWKRPNPSQPVACTGEAIWIFKEGLWAPVESCSGTCEPQIHPEDVVFAPQPFEGQEFRSACTGSTSTKNKLTVRYPDLTHPRMLIGATGYAEFVADRANEDDNTTMHYKVIISDQECPIQNVLVNRFCGSTNPTGTKPVPRFPWPLSQKANGPILGINLHNLATNGGTAEFIRAHEADEWDVLQTTLETKKMLLPALDGTCKMFELPIQVYTCEIPALSTQFQFVDAIVEAKITVTKNSDSGVDSGQGQATCSSPVIDIETKKQKVLGCGPVSQFQASSLPFPLIKQDVLADMDMTGCPEWVNAIILVLGICGETPEVAECEEVCPDSGSGVSQ